MPFSIAVCLLLNKNELISTYLWFFISLKQNMIIKINVGASIVSTQIKHGFELNTQMHFFYWGYLDSISLNKKITYIPIYCSWPHCYTDGAKTNGIEYVELRAGIKDLRELLRGRHNWLEETSQCNVIDYEQVIMQEVMSHRKCGTRPGSTPHGDLGIQISNEAMGPLNK